MKRELKEKYTIEEVNFANLVSVIMKDVPDTNQGGSAYWHSKKLENTLLLEIDFDNKCVNYNVSISSNMKNERYYQIVGACASRSYKFIEYWD